MAGTRTTASSSWYNAARSQRAPAPFGVDQRVIARAIAGIVSCDETGDLLLASRGSATFGILPLRFRPPSAVRHHLREKLRVLVLARSYPSVVFPTLGLWTERPTVLQADRCEIRVVSPVPWCPPLPAFSGLEQYSRFRRIPFSDRRYGVDIAHPRFVVGPGASLYPFEARMYAAGIARTIERIHSGFPFDLVHAHFVYPEGVVASRIARRYDVPFVITEHAPWTRWLDRPGIKRQAVPAAQAAAAIMPVSTSVLETIRHYAGDSVRATVVPVGVDEDLFVPADESARLPDQILYVGLINYNKGIDILLAAMSRLAEHGCTRPPASRRRQLLPEHAAPGGTPARARGGARPRGPGDLSRPSAARPRSHG